MKRRLGRLAATLMSPNPSARASSSPRCASSSARRRVVHEPPRILVVDDNEANLDIAKMRLESQGYEVVTAVDGEDALSKVRARAPDLLLLDIMMPKLDGIEVTRRLKADASVPFMPIILVTAKADAK